VNRAALASTPALALVLAGCLGPRVSDELGGPSGILPAGSMVPSADDDRALDARIAANDLVTGVVPRGSAFAGGEPAHAWDFGLAPDFAAPLFVLVRETAPDVYERIDHPPISETVPGDPGYSPYGSLFYVEITDAYQGELITSPYALQEAVDDGLVMPPALQLRAVDYPIVASDVRLDLGGGAAPLAPAGRLFYQGELVRYYDLGAIALDQGVHVPEVPRYVLRRDGGEPLSEPVRHIDLDGDGDILDSNDVFAARPADETYAARWRTVTVAVPAATASIDTSHDETVADMRAATQLFDPDPVAGVVLAFDVTDEVRHIALQRTAGGL
jgi:hypothetical protein